MDGIHDMGGMHHFRKMKPEKNEPVFHAAWEGRCLALDRVMSAIGAWTIDEGRAGIEALPPEVYLSWWLLPRQSEHCGYQNIVVRARACRR